MSRIEFEDLSVAERTAPTPLAPKQMPVQRHAALDPYARPSPYLQPRPVKSVAVDPLTQPVPQEVSDENVELEIETEAMDANSEEEDFSDIAEVVADEDDGVVLEEPPSMVPSER